MSIFHLNGTRSTPSTYCLLPVKSILPQSKNHAAKVGVCVPSSCSTTHLAQVFNKLLSNSHTVRVDTNQPLQCLWHPTGTLSSWQLWAMVSFAIIFGYIALSTWLDMSFGIDKGIYRLCFVIVEKLVDWSHKISKHFFAAWCLSFSLYRNIKQLLKIDTGGSRISCLDGIRTLAMFSIIAVHMFQIHLPKPLLYNESEQRRVNFRFGKLDLGVDTFFVVGGATLAYQFLGAREKG